MQRRNSLCECRKPGLGNCVVKQRDLSVSVRPTAPTNYATIKNRPCRYVLYVPRRRCDGRVLVVVGDDVNGNSLANAQLGRGGGDVGGPVPIGVAIRILRGAVRRGRGGIGGG